MEIVFKNGEKIKVVQELVNILSKEYKEGVKFYFFYDENKNVRFMKEIKFLDFVNLEDADPAYRKVEEKYLGKFARKY